MKKIILIVMLLFVSKLCFSQSEDDSGIVKNLEPLTFKDEYVGEIIIYFSKNISKLINQKIDGGHEMGNMGTLHIYFDFSSFEHF